MAQLIVRKLDDKAKEHLRARARRNGRSLEAEARIILESAAGMTPADSALEGPSAEKGFGTLMTELFGKRGLTPHQRRKFDRAVSELNEKSKMRIPDFEE
jgi:hypothetical protein